MTDGRTDGRADGPSDGRANGPSDDLVADALAGLTERRVRDRLHLAVAALEPDPAALSRIRHAVPRRRARHRNVWTGAAAVALTALATLPALHVGPPFDLTDGASAGALGAPADAAHTPHPAGTGPSWPARPSALPGGTLGDPSGSTAGASGSSGSPSAGAPATGQPPAVPLCLPSFLGRVDSHLEAADATGTAYGWFAVVNTSAQSCRLAGPGVLTAGTAGSPVPGVTVTGHTAGDPAAALPDPATAPRDLVLVPGGGYLVRFAWIPAGSCPTATAAPSGQPAPQPAPGVASQAAAPADGSGSATAGDVASPAPTPGGPSPTATPGTATPLTVGYTPQTDGPTMATAVVQNTCGGTLYHSAPEPAPATAPGATSSPAK